MLALALCASWPAAAADQDRARAAVQAGEALPLNQVLSRLSGRYPGRLIDADLRRDGSRWIYRIRLLDSNGTERRLTVDARNASILSVREGGRR
ncbi:MAG: PepSY domain-containing protein [Alphaproteobacteria bacterium]